MATEGSLYFTYWTYVGARLAKDEASAKFPPASTRASLCLGNRRTS